jgi:hypothetical protein
MPMPDRYTVQLKTAWASNTGGPYQTVWDRAIVMATGTVRTVAATALSLASNSIQNSVEVFRPADAPAYGSNSARSILQAPITLGVNRDVVFGVVTQPGSLVTAGDVLELRTYSDTPGGTQSFGGLIASVEIERT